MRRTEGGEAATMEHVIANSFQQFQREAERPKVGAHVPTSPCLTSPPPPHPPRDALGGKGLSGVSTPHHRGAMSALQLAAELEDLETQAAAMNLEGEEQLKEYRSVSGRAGAGLPAWTLRYQHSLHSVPRLRLPDGQGTATPTAVSRKHQIAILPHARTPSLGLSPATCLVTCSCEVVLMHMPTSYGGRCSAQTTCCTFYALAGWCTCKISR